MKVTVTYELEDKEGNVLRDRVTQDFLVYTLAHASVNLDHYGKIGTDRINHLKKEWDKNYGN